MLLVRLIGILGTTGVLVLSGCDRFGAQLPECAAPEVVDLATKALGSVPVIKESGIEFELSIPGEVRREDSPQKRICRAMLESELGTEGLYYAVSWQQKDQGVIWVEILGNEDTGS